MPPCPLLFTCGSLQGMWPSDTFWGEGLGLDGFRPLATFRGRGLVSSLWLYAPMKRMTVRCWQKDLLFCAVQHLAQGSLDPWLGPYRATVKLSKSV